MARTDTEAVESDYKCVSGQTKNANDMMWNAIHALSYRPDATDPNGLKFPHGTSLPQFRNVDMERFVVLAITEEISKLAAGNYAIGVREIRGIGIRTIDQQGILTPAVSGEMTTKGKHLLGLKRGDEFPHIELGTGWYLVFEGDTGTHLAPVNRLLKTSFRAIKKA
jgi:hypothetical protein